MNKRKITLRGIQLALVVCLILLGAILITSGFDLLGQSFHNTSNTITAIVVLALLWGGMELCAHRQAVWQFLHANRGVFAVAMGILVLAGVPRLWNLDGHSLNVDEPLWMQRGVHLYWMVTDGEYIKATENLGHPGIIPAALIGNSIVKLGEGVSSRSLSVMNEVSAARLPIAVLGMLTCVLLYVLGRRVWGNVPALFGALMLALDPAHTALSRVAHVDATLALFCMLTLLCFWIGEKKNSTRWVMAAGLFWGCALLTKGPAWLMPGILVAVKLMCCAMERRWLFRVRDVSAMLLGLGVYMLFFTRLWQDPTLTAWWREGDEAFRPYAAVHGVGEFFQQTKLPFVLAGKFILFAGWKWMRANVPLREQGPVLRGLGLSILVLCVFTLFPHPVENMTLMFRKLFELGTGRGVSDVITHAPPEYNRLLFYPLALMTRLPLVVVGCALLGIGVMVCRAWADRRSDAAFLLLVITLFVAAMSHSERMGFRYILPVLPFVMICAGAGVEKMVGRFSRGTILGCAGIALCLLPFHGMYAPNYYLFHNSLVGGPKGVQASSSIGWGEGQKEAVAYLKQLGAKDSVYICVIGDAAVVKYYWEHMEPLQPEARVGSRGIDKANYVIVTDSWRERNRSSRVRRFLEARDPDHTITLQGVDIVWIYLRDH